MGRFPIITALVALVAAQITGCGASTETVEPEAPAEEPSTAGWPSHLLAGDGVGPALYLTPEADSPPVGYVSPGVKLRLASTPEGDRIPVWVDGPLKVRGWFPMQRLSARVQRRGRVNDTPAYLGPNDVVGVRGAAPEERLRVEVRPWLGRPGAPELGSFVGEYPVIGLGAESVDPNAVEGPSPGEPHLLPAGQEVPLYDRPNGEVLATLPALDPPLTVVVLRDQGEWKGIRAGVGPYLVGFVNTALTPTDAPPAGEPRRLGDAAGTGNVPARLQTDADRPLWRVAAGTRVKFDDETIAQLNEAGWAREMNRFETGEVDVFIAVNDDVAIRGVVEASRLEEASPGESQTAPPVAPTQGATPGSPEPEVQGGTQGGTQQGPQGAGQDTERPSRGLVSPQ